MLAVTLPLNYSAPRFSHLLTTICYGIPEYYGVCDLRAEVDVNPNTVALRDRQHPLDVKETLLVSFPSTQEVAKVSVTLKYEFKLYQRYV